MAIQQRRTTKETDIFVKLELYGKGVPDIQTGIGFFDHMLTALCVHAGFDLTVQATGDLQVDCHHTVEDVGIVLGQAFLKATQQRAALARYGSFYVPMDEALAFCCVDISSRPYLVYNCELINPQVGAFDTCMAEEFFRAFAMNAQITLHVNCLYGKNDHHKIEAMFKALGNALHLACAKREGYILSTKGSL